MLPSDQVAGRHVHRFGVPPDPSEDMLMRSGPAASRTMLVTPAPARPSPPAIDALLNTSLFAADRLTLELLRTFRAHPPLPARRIGDGPVLLVVENADTFDTLTRVLADAPGEVGWVAWGAGASAARTAAREGFPLVRPATGLYRLLLEQGTSQLGQPQLDPEKAVELSSWLTEPQAAQAVALLTVGHRLAQEAVGIRLLQERIVDGEWRAGLEA